MLTILSIDPGLADLGWSVLQFDADQVVVADIGLLHTSPMPEKERKAINRSHSEDQLYRCRAVAAHLMSRTIGEDENGVVGAAAVAVVCEAMTYMRSAKANMAMGMAYGIVSSISAMLDIPIVDITPKQVKQLVTGEASASKNAVFDALRKRGVQLTPRAVQNIAAVTKSRHNHMTDSVAIGCAAIWGSPVLKTAIQIAAKAAAKVPA